MRIIHYLVNLVWFNYYIITHNPERHMLSNGLLKGGCGYAILRIILLVFVTCFIFKIAGMLFGVYYLYMFSLFYLICSFLIVSYGCNIDVWNRYLEIYFGITKGKKIYYERKYDGYIFLFLIIVSAIITFHLF